MDLPSNSNYKDEQIQLLNQQHSISLLPDCVVLDRIGATISIVSIFISALNQQINEKTGTRNDIKD